MSKSSGLFRKNRPGILALGGSLMLVGFGFYQGIDRCFCGSADESTTRFVRYLSGAVERFKMDVGRYPWTNESFAVLVDPPVDAAIRARWRGPYLETGAPMDLWGRRYQYEFLGARSHRLFEIYSLGPDGIKSADDFFY